MNQSNSFNLRIAVLFPFGNLGAFPGLADAAELLAERGYLMDIYTINNTIYPSPEMETRGISLITNHPEVFLTFTRVYPRVIVRLKKGGRPFRWFVMKIYYPLLRRLFFFRLLRRQYTGCPYSCVIGMDPEGLVAAALMAEKLHVPLVYWSLELLFTNEIVTNQQRHLKEQEITLSRKANF
jgi:adenine/guanine phosphoribosyltransferase-like PRPP-binding protein